MNRIFGITAIVVVGSALCAVGISSVVERSAAPTPESRNKGTHEVVFADVQLPTLPAMPEATAVAIDDSVVDNAPVDEKPVMVLPTYTLAPCPTEDSENCYWDAANMGNGGGTSFISLNGTWYYPEGSGF